MYVVRSQEKMIGEGSNTVRLRSKGWVLKHGGDAGYHLTSYRLSVCTGMGAAYWRGGGTDLWRKVGLSSRNSFICTI